MKTFDADELVLVRSNHNREWTLSRYSHLSKSEDKSHHILQNFGIWDDENIIPYKGNEDLLGTKFSVYSTWRPVVNELIAVSNDNINWDYGKFCKINGDKVVVMYNANSNAHIKEFLYYEPLEKHFIVSRFK